jgi:hypothetical protein
MIQKAIEDIIKDIIKDEWNMQSNGWLMKVMFFILGPKFETMWA